MSVSECACAGARLGELRVRGKNNMRINLKKNFLLLEKNEKKISAHFVNVSGQRRKQQQTGPSVHTHVHALTHFTPTSIHA